MTSWEQYAQDDSTVVITHAAREDYRLSCDCGWTANAGAETQANNRAMSHILEHDIAYEDDDSDSL